jgi:hypothetical protein
MTEAAAMRRMVTVRIAVTEMRGSNLGAAFSSMQNGHLSVAAHALRPETLSPGRSTAASKEEEA